MDTYVAKVQIGNNANDLTPIASTMFGICNSESTDSAKLVTFAKFDKLVHGVTIHVKFVHGNVLPSNLTLQVGATLAYPITGNCICGDNEIISFTFEEVSATTKYWRVNASGISSALQDYIITTINSTSTTPDVLIFKGSVGVGGNPGHLPSSGYQVGWTYRVFADGTYANQGCSEGDLIIAIQDAVAGQNTINPAHWIVIQHKLQTTVSGPSSSTHNHVVVFNGTSGQLLADSGFTIATDVPANAVFTDTTYDAGQGLLLNNNNVFSIDFGETAGTAVEGNDSRLSDAREPTSHEHGNISNDGTIGTIHDNALLRVTNGEIDIGPELGNDATLYLNNRGEWAEPSYPVLEVNGHTGEVTLQPSDLGLETAIRYIGHVAADSTYHPSDGTAPVGQQVLRISGLDSYTPRAGDVIIDKDDAREYIYSTANVWELLGTDDQYKIIQTGVTAPEERTNRWVSTIEQNENGEISVTYSDLNATISWNGNADTATAFATGQQVYVDLTNASQTKTITGGSSDPQDIGVDGILGVANGGTGTDTFITDEVILSTTVNNTVILTSRAYTDNSSATALRDNITNFITERSIYYGLPQFNDQHNYNSNSVYYAPTSPGNQYALLVYDTARINNSDVGNPIWTAAATLESDTSSLHQTILTLGNEYTSNTHSNGIIQLYSTGNNMHILSGKATSTNDYTHQFHNANGFILQGPDEAVGSETQPVYFTANGIATALTYTEGRLYYSASETSFEAADHFASATQIGINITSWPEASGDPLGGVLYVNGSATINGSLDIINNAALGDNLVVAGITELTGNVGIGDEPEDGLTAHLLTVYGTSHFIDVADFDKNINITDDTHATSLVGALVVEGGILTKDNLYVTTTSELEGKVYIGSTVEVNNSTYQLTINGSTQIIDGANDIAYLQLTELNVSSPKVLSFIPATSEKGYIGTSNNKWYSGYFSNLLTIGTNNVQLDGNGTITLQTQNNAHQIILDANNKGTITVKTAIPSIILDTTASNKPTWEIINNAGEFNLSINSTALLTGKNNYGFEIGSSASSLSLYINESIPSSGYYNLYVNGTSALNGHTGINTTPDITSNSNIALKVNGEMTILNNDGTTNTDLIYIRFNTNNTNPLIYPATTNTGSIGTSSNRWTEGYFNSTLEVGTRTSYLTGVNLNGTGSLTISNGNINSIVADCITTNYNTVTFTGGNNTITTTGASNILTLTSTGTSTSSIVITTTNSNEGSITITAASPTIDFICNGNTVTDWTLFNDIGIITLINNVTPTVSLTGGNINNVRGFSIIPALGIDADPESGYALFVNGASYLLGNVTIEGDLLPDDNDSHDIGFASGNTQLRWRDLYLSSSINILDSSGQLMAYSDHLTIRAQKPEITLNTTTSNRANWQITNDEGVLTITNSLYSLYGNNSGLQLGTSSNNSYFYINETLPTTNVRKYNLYVNGETYLTDNLIFEQRTLSNGSIGINWSGGTNDNVVNTASIYYQVDYTTISHLVANTNHANCLISFAHNNIYTAHIKPSGPSFYPDTTNTGTLGLPNTSVNNVDNGLRWAGAYIGTYDTYGDPYQPIYWNNGVPTKTDGTVQYNTFTIEQGETSVTLKHAAYKPDDTIFSYVIQIVITNGEEYLRSPITWTSQVDSQDTTLGAITLSTDYAVADDVEGYIITARCANLAPIASSNTPTPSP